MVPIISSKNKEKYTHRYQEADPLLYPTLKEYAKQMRANPTDAEAFLWQQFRGGFFGHSFRRQHIIGDSIADFVCLKSHLVIEIDGHYHDSLRQQLHDALRTECLKNQGYRVIRFTNEDVLCNIDSVLTTIRQNL